jgi:hypothetical protein
LRRDAIKEKPMPTLAEILRAIKAAILNAWSPKAAAPAPERIKLKGRPGYGEDDRPAGP